MIRVLAAGDRFIRSARLSAALEAHIAGTLEIREIEFPWPDEPFRAVAEVNEASGTEEQLIQALQGVTALVTQLAPVTARVMDESPELRIIGVCRGGPTNVNISAAKERGIQVSNVPGRNGVATAEMTIGLTLAALRGIPYAHDGLLRGEWRGDLYRDDAVGGEILGSTVGLIGAGAVGTHVARIMHAMGAHVVVYDPYLRRGALEGIAEHVHTVDEVFRRSNVVSVHARLTPETATIVNATRLALLPDNAVLVNAARGGLVDYEAVADAIETGRLRAAAFDVFPSEPLDFSSRIVSLAREGHNVVLTPHIAGASTPSAQRAADGVAEEVRRYLAGEPALHSMVDGVPFSNARVGEEAS